MKRSYVVVTVSLLALAAVPLSGQQSTDVRLAVLFENYSFESGLPYKSLSEVTVPVGIDLGLGRVGSLALSGGWTSVSLNDEDADPGDQKQPSLMDTEARLSLNVIPGNLVLLANGAIPTGVKTVHRDELSILGAIASDVIGLAASQLGTGGNVGGGFVGAIPLGRWALGLGGTYKQPLSYVPVIGETDELKPGAEFRTRAGVEGPIGRRSYLRVAGIYAMRSKDAVGDEPQHGIGNRIVGYVSLNQGIGSSSLVLYGFDVFRSDAQVEPTAIGAAVLPRGNLIVAGARWAFNMGSGATLSPRAEFRLSAQAPDTLDNALALRGRSIRGGLDLRAQLSSVASLVFQVDGITGFVREAGENVGLKGFRVAVHTEFRP